jgi:hypothetical protein
VGKPLVPLLLVLVLLANLLLVEMFCCCCETVIVEVVVLDEGGELGGDGDGVRVLLTEFSSGEMACNVGGIESGGDISMGL